MKIINLKKIIIKLLTKEQQELYEIQKSIIFVMKSLKQIFKR